MSRFLGCGARTLFGILAVAALSALMAVGCSDDGGGTSIDGQMVGTWVESEGAAEEYDVGVVFSKSGKMTFIMYVYGDWYIAEGMTGNITTKDGTYTVKINVDGERLEFTGTYDIEDGVMTRANDAASGSDGYPLIFYKKTGISPKKQP